MSEVTVGSLAKVLGMPPEKLLEQLAGAGMTFSGPEQVVSSTEKMKLLGFLRRTHGKDDKPAEAAAPKQITLKRRKDAGAPPIPVGGAKNDIIAIVIGTIIYLALGFVFHPLVVGVPAFATPALGH